MRLTVVALAAVVLAVGAVASAVRDPAPLVYGEKTAREQARAAAELKRDPPIVDYATQVNTVFDKKWRPTVPDRVVSLPVPRKPAKAPTPYKDGIVISHLADPKPKKHKLRADPGVRAHVLEYVNEKRAVREEPTVRAHVITDIPTPKRKVKRDLVTANAHITNDEPKPKKRRVRELVVANAHITNDEPKKKKQRRTRDLVTPIAHITPDPTPVKRHRRKAKEELVTPHTSITVDEPRKHKRKAHKPKPEIVSADVNLFPGEKVDGAVKPPKQKKWWQS